ncbi:MAG TPA: hypothetical protein EYP85_14315, partial [Armatimonadetes bacterium]|nr:hypothetical protein [Armatimonadota bacterium]
MVNLTTQFVGLTLRSPLLVGSAGVTANLELMKRAQDYGAGGVVVKSLFDFVPGRKSPTPRFQLLSRTLNDPRATTLYSIEQGIALDPAGYAEEIARAKRELDIAVIASVDCVQEENWVPYVTTVAQARPDALEINVSCPHGSIAFTGGEVEEAMLRVARRVREAVPYLPLIVKLTGQLTFPPGLVLRLQEMGIEGVTLFNRFTGLEVDLERERPVLHGGYAGHGGAWSLQFGLRWIAALAPQVKLDLSASGGVMSGYDVAKYLLAGATTVQTVSAVYLHGHRIVERFTRELVAFMEAKGYTTVDEFRGRLTDSIVPLERIDRRTRVKVALTRRVEPPCKWACPLGKHVQAFLELVAEGRFAEAYDLLTACDPFPRLTARVCYAPCEEACTRHLADEPLAIRRLERLVADWGWKERQEAARMEELGTGEPRDREHLYPQDKGYRLTGPSLRER